ncbi:hypothetical protein FE840_005415 [Peteryoungia desertarenae]|uniref:Uncharacterized protein n=1 Tax=Peteryoungia desertarenae TaxID=1813451 RepID=A0ABX6QKL8_9HYPH|nr:hypothetical protein [Peteryoungia desertarenae]QLF69024.1 hypothetical protein FE840_005415 [Peteryoungia desertarenae]
MRTTARLSPLSWLAFGPAAFSLILTTGTVLAQDKGHLASVHRQVSLAEASVTKAIGAGDSKTLSRIGQELGSIIETALAHRENGGEVTRCDMAAHALAYVAVSAADGLSITGEGRKLLLGDALAAAGDFEADMRACDQQAGKKPGSHTSVEKALRAL